MSKINSDRIAFEIYKNFTNEIGPWEENFCSPFEFNFEKPKKPQEKKENKEKEFKKIKKKNMSDSIERKISISSSISNPHEIKSKISTIFPKISINIFPKIKNRTKNEFSSHNSIINNMNIPLQMKVKSSSCEKKDKTEEILTKNQAIFRNTKENMLKAKENFLKTKETVLKINTKSIKKYSFSDNFDEKTKFLENITDKREIDNKFTRKYNGINSCIQNEKIKNEKLKNTIRSMLNKNCERAESLIKVYQKINKNTLKNPIMPNNSFFYRGNNMTSELNKENLKKIQAKNKYILNTEINCDRSPGIIKTNCSSLEELLKF